MATQHAVLILSVPLTKEPFSYFSEYNIYIIYKYKYPLHMSNIAEAICQHVHAKVKWNIQYQNIYIPFQLPQ